VLRAFAEQQPITPVIETIRGLLTGTPIGSAGLRAVAWSAGLLAVFAVLAVGLYRRRTRG
jgi:ABC-2 type transport system permease protein